MRINVVFGSKSDKDVFEPLCEGLKAIDDLKLKMEVCSAHRDPERLRELIKDNPCDLYIAGAGLAAHLPGVVASQTQTPVIGIPCMDILQGHDALLSVLQMPKGVPVMTAGVSNIESVVRFARWYAANRGQPPVFRLHCPDWAESLAEQLRAPLERIGWDFVKQSPDVDHPPSVFPLALADLFAPPAMALTAEGLARQLPGSKPGLWLGVPVFAQPPYLGDPSQIDRITETGGLWLGVNNITNLQISLLQLWSTGAKEKELLSELRGGQKQSVR